MAESTTPHDYKPISLGIQSNPTREGRNFSARLENCFAEENGNEGITPISIFPMPGLRNFTASIDDAGVRAQLEFGSSLYVVAGRNLYMINSFGDSTLIGGIPTDGAVYMERNRNDQIGIVSDGSYWTVESNVLTLNTDPDLPAPISFGYHDGYGILGIADGRWFITGIDDFTTIDALDFTKAESNPDALVRAIGFEREVVVFGSASTEFYQNTGNADFPYQRASAIQVGCLGGNTVAKVASKSVNALCFVANDHTVRRLEGYTPIVISTNEIDEVIRAYAESGADLTLLRATSWQDGGRFFYSLSCPQFTRIYNSKTQLWHDGRSKAMDRWRVDNVVRFGTKLIAGDYSTGQLYTMSSDYYDEAGDEMTIRIVTPAVHMAPYRFILDAWRLLLETGTGLISGDAADTNPRVMIRISRDGGKTWHGQDTVEIGAKNATQTNVRGYRWGWGDIRGLTLEFSMSAKVMRRFDGAWAATRMLAA